MVRNLTHMQLKSWKERKALVETMFEDNFQTYERYHATDARSQHTLGKPSKTKET